MRVLILAIAAVLVHFSAASATEWTGTLKRIGESGQINLGYRVSQPPMSFEDESGNPVGYSVDLCDRVATAVKQTLNRSDITVSYVPVTAENRFDAIVAGDIDLLCGATTKTLGRSERVGFTQLTFVTGGALLSRDDNRVVGIEALKGRRVGVVSNTTTIVALDDAISEMLVDAEIVPLASSSDGMRMLDAGEIDAFSADQVVLVGQVVSRNSGEQYYLAEELFSFEPFALALARGDADFRLVADRALSHLSRSGRIRAIYQKWFGSFKQSAPAALQALYQLSATPE